MLIALGALVYAVYSQTKTNVTFDQVKNAEDTSLGLSGYNPYVLNQYVEWKDRIHSADVDENRIYSKPAQIDYGLLGLTQENIQLNPVDVNTVVYRRENLNL